MIVFDQRLTTKANIYVIYTIQSSWSLCFLRMSRVKLCGF